MSLRGDLRVFSLPPVTRCRADRRSQLGPHLTQGLGVGAKPEVGKAAGEELSEEEDVAIVPCRRQTSVGPNNEEPDRLS